MRFQKYRGIKLEIDIGYCCFAPPTAKTVYLNQLLHSTMQKTKNAFDPDLTQTGIISEKGFHMVLMWTTSPFASSLDYQEHSEYNRFQKFGNLNLAR